MLITPPMQLSVKLNPILLQKYQNQKLINNYNKHNTRILITTFHSSQAKPKHTKRVKTQIINSQQKLTRVTTQIINSQEKLKTLPRKSHQGQKKEQKQQ